MVATEPNRGRASLGRSVGERLAEDRGAAAVEFAIVAPVLLALVVGVLYFGRFLNYAIDETHMANVGARWAAVNYDTSSMGCGTLPQCVQSQANSAELRNGSSDVTQAAAVTVCFPNGTTNIGDPVRVVVTAVFHFLPLLGIAPITVAESATMRLEQVPTNYSGAAACP